MRSSEIIRLLQEDGWFVHTIRGSHHQFKHAVKSGKMTVPHPRSDLPKSTVRSIFKQAGLKRKE